MAKDNSKVTTNDTAITRFSSAAYLTFIAGTRKPAWKLFMQMKLFG